MDSSVIVGGVLVTGLVVFLVGAGGWRQDYQRALQESLPAIHRDRRRWVWIHTWMLAAMAITPAGLAGLAVVMGDVTATALTAMATLVYASGGVCWMASLAFRLTVVPWAAEHTVAEGRAPVGFPAYDRWAGSLYVVHMLTAYLASALLGLAVLASDALPAWLGWAGVGWGVAFAAGLVATRFAGMFNPPAWAHVYTAAVGVTLLVS